MRAWLERRFEFRHTVLKVLRHPIPASLDGRVGWFYVLGASILTVFALQVATGIALAFVYTPSAEAAYQTVHFITEDEPFGRIVRGMHFFGASAMLVLVALHVARVFLMGAYKFPREANWLTGAILFLATATMAITGQTMRWDQDAFWSAVIGAENAARVPLLGRWLTDLVIGGEEIGGQTLSRMFTLHVFLVPAVIFGAVGLHLYLVVRRGISEPPTPRVRVDPKTYPSVYQEILRTGIPYFPDAFWRDAVAALAVVAAILVLATVVGPPPLSESPDPSQINTDPRPDWYFRGYFAMFATAPLGFEGLFIVGVPLVLVAVLFAIPYVASRGERHPFRRPLSALALVVVYLGYGVLTYAGLTIPWEPVRVGEAHVPTLATKGLTPDELEGARLFETRSCISCHRIAGEGGGRGPDLTHVASRLHEDRIIERIANGGSEMPAYARAGLTAAEMDHLVRFLLTLK